MVAAALGWLGTVGTLLAYVLVARGRLVASSSWYAALNLTGGLMAAVAAGLYGAWPSAASNLVWALVGLHTLARRGLRGAGAARRGRPGSCRPSRTTRGSRRRSRW